MKIGGVVVLLVLVALCCGVSVSTNCVKTCKNMSHTKEEYKRCIASCKEHRSLGLASHEEVYSDDEVDLSVGSTICLGAGSNFRETPCGKVVGISNDFTTGRITASKYFRCDDSIGNYRWIKLDLGGVNKVWVADRGQFKSCPPSPSPIPTGSMAPLVWESTQFPERKQWSQYLQSIILNDWSSLLQGSSDIPGFCPRYYSLNNEQRSNVWAQLFAAVSQYESGFNPTARMMESTMGKDPVTGQPVYSEGILQLSYQDTTWAPWCPFDWSKDKSLQPTDPKKTILNPFSNLYCGVGIMARQIKSRNAIVVSSGVYWAVLRAEGKYQQISNIQRIVQSLPMCK